MTGGRRPARPARRARGYPQRRRPPAAGPRRPLVGVGSRDQRCPPADDSSSSSPFRRVPRTTGRRHASTSAAESDRDVRPPAPDDASGRSLRCGPWPSPAVSAVRDRAGDPAPRRRLVGPLAGRGVGGRPPRAARAADRTRAAAAARDPRAAGVRRPARAAIFVPGDLALVAKDASRTLRGRRANASLEFYGWSLLYHLPARRASG